MKQIFSKRKIIFCFLLSFGLKSYSADSIECTLSKYIDAKNTTPIQTAVGFLDVFTRSTKMSLADASVGLKVDVQYSRANMIIYMEANGRARTGAHQPAVFDVPFFNYTVAQDQIYTTECYVRAKNLKGEFGESILADTGLFLSRAIVQDLSKASSVGSICYELGRFENNMWSFFYFAANAKKILSAEAQDAVADMKNYTDNLKKYCSQAKPDLKVMRDASQQIESEFPTLMAEFGY